MLKNIGLLFVAGSMAVASPCALAIENYYAGANILRVTDDGEEADAINTIGAGIKGGITITENFAVEARYATGVRKGNSNFNGLPIELELDELYGVYVKGMLPIGARRVSPYLMAGYTTGQETYSIKGTNFSASARETRPSFGIGVDVPLSEKLSLNLEWARLLKGEDASGVGYRIEGLSFGAAYHF
jgi:opacity protein-like surface antigen